MKIIAPALGLYREAISDDIATTLQDIEGKVDPFLILEQDEMTYMQTLWTPEGFSLEYQEGSIKQHFISKFLLTREQVEACLNAFLRNDPSWKSTIEFEQKNITDMSFKIGRSIGHFFGSFIRGLSGK